MKQGKVLLLVLAIVLMGVSGYAMPVHLEEDTITLNGVVVSDASEVIPKDEEAEDAVSEEAEAEAAEASESVEEVEEVEEAKETVSLEVTDFHLLSKPAKDSLLVFAEGQFLLVPEDSLYKVIQQVGSADQLPKAQDFVVMRQKERNDNVRALQEALIAAGYLPAGSADGSYGGQTARALSAFGKDMGIANVTEANQLIQLLIASACEETINVTPHFDPAERYAALVGKTDANLQTPADYGLMLEYDDISGTGQFTNRNLVTLDATSESDIDACTFDMSFLLLVTQQDDGEIVVEPGVRVNCECVRRPIMQELILKSGDTRCTVAFGELSNALSGAKSIETATAVLGPDAVELLANAAEEGELKIRINCKYKFFDCEVENIEPISNICKAAQGL